VALSKEVLHCEEVQSVERVGYQVTDSRAARDGDGEGIRPFRRSSSARDRGCIPVRREE
jgi:hypothetical protein